MNISQAMKFTKILGYLTMTANGILKLSSNIIRKTSDAITDTRRYKVEILNDDGEIVSQEENLTNKAVNKKLDSSSNLGLKTVVVTEMK